MKLLNTSVIVLALLLSYSRCSLCFHNCCKMDPLTANAPTEALPIYSSRKNLDPNDTYKTSTTIVNGTVTPPPDAESPPISTVELCIAHFNEDLSWLAPFSSNCSVYSKGSSPEDTITFAHANRLPNIGRETHTYLTHITQNYDSLPHVTLFLQGNIHDINEGTPAHVGQSAHAALACIPTSHTIPNLTNASISVTNRQTSRSAN